MAQPNALDYDFQTGPLVPYEDVPVQYTVSYKWGTLRVSEEADQLYGLRPLTGRVVEGSSSKPLRLGRKPDVRIDVFLLGPGEYGRIFAESLDLSGERIEPVSHHAMYPGGLAVAAAFNTDVETMRSTEVAAMLELAEKLELDEQDDSIPDGDRERAYAFLVKQGMADALIGSMCNMLFRECRYPLARQVRNESKKDSLPENLVLGGLAAFMFGADLAVGLPAGTVLAAAGGVIASKVGLPKVKLYAANLLRDEQTPRIIGEKCSKTIARDVYATFAET